MKNSCGFWLAKWIIFDNCGLSYLQQIHGIYAFTEEVILSHTLLCFTFCSGKIREVFKHSWSAVTWCDLRTSPGFGTWPTRPCGWSPSTCCCAIWTEAPLPQNSLGSLESTRPRMWYNFEAVRKFWFRCWHIDERHSGTFMCLQIHICHGHNLEWGWGTSTSRKACFCSVLHLCQHFANSQICFKYINHILSTFDTSGGSSLWKLDYQTHAQGPIIYTHCREMLQRC